ncbi:hypothetical protein NUW54_g9843 [Trametes sanguinea]|uniref:Uncharacterized protein n=1 Tax=Trametes sanguinea TaxID=158606 RepID=A0ACC1P3B8_9APHY|nr:hypothetical protein NUW54_g9843 [Trametes sanguinea]
MYALPSMPDHDIPGHSNNDRHLPHGMRNLPYSTHFNDEQGRKGFADVDAISMRRSFQVCSSTKASNFVSDSSIVVAAASRDRTRPVSTRAQNATVNGIFYEGDHYGQRRPSGERRGGVNSMQSLPVMAMLITRTDNLTKELFRWRKHTGYCPDTIPSWQHNILPNRRVEWHAIFKLVGFNHSTPRGATRLLSKRSDSTPHPTNRNCAARRHNTNNPRDKSPRASYERQSSLFAALRDNKCDERPRGDIRVFLCHSIDTRAGRSCATVTTFARARDLPDANTTIARAQQPPHAYKTSARAQHLPDASTTIARTQQPPQAYTTVARTTPS